MISFIFRLRCDENHEWEEVRYGQDASLGIALCPVCGDREIPFWILSVEAEWLWPSLPMEGA